MTDNSNNICGLKKNWITLDELREIIDVIINKCSKDDVLHGGVASGIAPGNLAYPWFKKKILERLRHEFDSRLDLMFAAYISATRPVGAHSDHFPLPRPGEQYLSFLIPYSVDNDISLVQKSKTVIFDQADVGSKFPTNFPKGTLPQIEPKESSAVNLHDSLLAHIPLETCEQLTVKMIADWEQGALIYWDNKLIHCSDDFKKSGYNTKECLVIHTFIPS